MYRVGDTVFDQGRAKVGVVSKVYPFGGLLNLSDDKGPPWLAASERCKIHRPPGKIKRAKQEKPEPIQIPPGTVPRNNCPPSDIRVGDYVVFGGRPRMVRDMRGRIGATRTLIFDGGKARPAKAGEVVYRTR